ncbi:MAG: response regulator [Myxococcales bacterium]|nr:response regulator [Myxococcales bacterium]HRC56136.1 response regulator [Kofleriaceae bacterium]
MTGTSHEPIQILLVEDSASDAELTIDALRSARVLNAVHRVCDGVEALAYLRRQGEYATATRPDLILLDLNLPRMNGYELLEVIKQDDSFALIPVVVLTTSHADRDILRSYQLRANCYVSKPVALQEFLDVVQETGNFWLQLVRLPPAR